MDCGSSGLSEITVFGTGILKVPERCTVYTRTMKITAFQGYNINVSTPMLDFSITTNSCCISEVRGELSDYKVTKVISLSNLKQNSDSAIKALDTIITARFDNLDSRISTVETKIQKDLTSANITNDELRRVNNEQDQHSRLNNVEISGVPVSNDNIHRVRRFVNPNISEGQTQSSSSRPPAIIVRFSRRLRKDTLIAAVRARRGLTTADIGLPGPTVNLYLSDHLTPSNKLLLKQARKIKED
ncbi:unnamed protein product [Leptidea sinapis]|uniref:Uncharacterized protein n=1 Tax=Leptidea sinapis TaxID=189913 RepID=A0A5E4QPF2_9NEOP|nr:unnamed protein product [Leptidea sinapis]